MRTNVTIGSFVPGNESAWERSVPVPTTYSFEKPVNVSSALYSLYIVTRESKQGSFNCCYTAIDE